MKSSELYKQTSNRKQAKYRMFGQPIETGNKDNLTFEEIEAIPSIEKERSNG